MTFYIKPPGGSISLSSLYKDAETRLLFLCQLEECWGDRKEVQHILARHPHIAANSDCLIEGSHKDRSSHYVLRLACLGSVQLQAFLTEAETQLFEYRLGCGGKSALRNTVSGLLRHINYALKHLRLSLPYHQLLLQIKEVSSEVLTSEMLDCGTENLCNHSIRVPWILIETLVKERSVIVTKGKAEIHCKCLLQLLSSVFKKTLEFGIKQLSVSDAEDSFFHDARMVRVKKSLCRLFRRHHNGSHHTPHTLTILRHQEIEDQVQYFPPCMQGLHKTLVKYSRLRHHSRFRYTLFLKDIGVPWWESVAFWEEFYSKPHSGAAAGCCHTWEGHEGSRYTYGIKHMYGMEGGRKNYTSHSCSALQELMPQPQEPGGCPFTSLNIEEISHLSPHLHNNLHLQQTITKEVKAGRPSAACKMLLGHTMLMYKKAKGAQDKISPKLESIHKRIGVNRTDGGETKVCCNASSLNLVSDKKTCSRRVRSSELATTPPGCCSTHNQTKANMESSHYDGAKRNQISSSLVPAHHPHSGTSAAISYDHSTEKIQAVSRKGVQDSDVADLGSSGIGGNSSCETVETEKIWDIEDVRSMLSNCQFYRPSHYYLKVCEQ